MSNKRLSLKHSIYAYGTSKNVLAKGRFEVRVHKHTGALQSPEENGKWVTRKNPFYEATFMPYDLSPTYICVTRGRNNKRALYFLRSIGRRRIYRSHFDFPPSKFRLLTYKNKNNAIFVCEQVNKFHGDNFEAVELK